MASCLRQQNELSVGRLITAYRWFEQIPALKSDPLVSPEDIKSIADTAMKRARELGYDQWERRITGALSSIRNESDNEKLDRVYELVSSKTGSAILEGDMLQGLRDARRFRGRGAHGHFVPKDEEEFRSFACASYALEAVSFLFMNVD